MIERVDKHLRKGTLARNRRQSRSTNSRLDSVPATRRTRPDNRKQPAPRISGVQKRQVFVTPQRVVLDRKPPVSRTHFEREQATQNRRRQLSNGVWGEDEHDTRSPA